MVTTRMHRVKMPMATCMVDVGADVGAADVIMGADVADVAAMQRTGPGA